MSLLRLGKMVEKITKLETYLGSHNLTICCPHNRLLMVIKARSRPCDGKMGDQSLADLVRFAEKLGIRSSVA